MCPHNHDATRPEALNTIWERHGVEIFSTSILWLNFKKHHL